MVRRWLLSAIVLLVGVLIAGGWVASGSVSAAAVGLVFFVVGAWLLSPWFFPRSVSAAEADRRSRADGSPIVYWRPGCQYCLRLRIRLGATARQLHWVDIWRDPDAAAKVRAYAEGNETVPTVVVAGQAHVNPDPAWLKRLARPAG